MKKLAIIGGILLLTVISYPAFARGPGYGGGAMGMVRDTVGTLMVGLEI